MDVSKYIRTFFLQLFISTICFAQGKKIESLKNVLYSLRDTARIDCLGEVGFYYLLNFQKDSSNYYINIIEEESERFNYIHGKAIVCIQKAAFANHFFNDFSTMEQMAHAAINWFDLTSNKKQIEIAYWQLGRAQTNQSNYKEALTNLRLAYEWAKKAGVEHVKGMVLETMTDIYRDKGEYVNLLGAQQELIKIDRASGDTGYYSFHELWVLGLMYRLMEEYPTALPFWRQLFLNRMNFTTIGAWNQMEYAELLTLSGRHDSARYYYNKFDSANADIKDIRYFLISKGEYYSSLKLYSAALPYFKRGLMYHRQLNDRSQVKRALLDIAKTYTVLQKNDSAIRYAREALHMAIQTGSKPSIRDGYEIFFAVYDRLHQSDSAYYYYHSFINMKEAVMNDQTRGKLAAYNYEHKIRLLDKEKQLQQQQLSQTAQQKKFLIVGIAGIFLLVIFLIRNIVLKRKNESARRAILENELLLQKFENEKTKAELQQQAIELEMQALRSQMNPHFIFNSLNSINRFILQNNKLQASEYLTKFSKLVRLILQNSQSALISLESELESLELYLQLEALRFDHHFDFTISVNVELDADIIRVSPLIIQPYAENAIWHGLMHKEEKGHLDVEIFQDGAALCCKITDDGIGRKVSAGLKSGSAQTHKSMGMQITANRIEILQQNNGLDASIKIIDLVLPDGSAGGTEVTIKMPLIE